jgi:hypothetical protein
LQDAPRLARLLHRLADLAARAQVLRCVISSADPPAAVALRVLRAVRSGV